jgi:hypothetical protein
MPLSRSEELQCLSLRRASTHITVAARGKAAQRP